MWLAVDEDGEEWIYEEKPVRHSWFWDCEDEVIFIEVPKGTIQRLLNYPLTWDDDCQEIIEYKDKDLKEDKMIKQNIKMRVTPEQSKKVQEICFANGVCWRSGEEVVLSIDKPFLFIDEYISFMCEEEEKEDFLKDENEEVSAELFIRTNGTCEESRVLNDDTQRNIVFAPNADEHLRQKIVNLHDQLNKNRKTVQNQKEELTRLLSQKEDLQNRLNISNKTIGMSIDTDIELIRLLEEKDAIIKYLESKLVKKTNEAYEKKVMSFEELYIKQADEYYKKVEDKAMGFVIKDLESKLYN